MPGRSDIGEKSTDVERDMLAYKRRPVITQRLNLLAGDGGKPVNSSEPVLERNQDLLEQAIDYWYGGFQMCIILVLFLIDSTFA